MGALQVPSLIPQIYWKEIYPTKTATMTKHAQNSLLEDLYWQQAENLISREF